MRTLFCLAYFLSAWSLAAQDLFPIKVNNQWGLIDTQGQIVVEPIYDAIGEFRQFHYAVMQRDGMVGMLNGQAQEIISPRYDDLKVLDSTHIAVMHQNEWMLVDLNENIILDKGYERVTMLDNGFLKVMYDGKWCVVDPNGKHLCDATYDEIEILQDKYFLTHLNDQVGLLSLDGKLLLGARCEQIVPLADQVILYRLYDQWGITTLEGQILIDPSFDSYKMLGTQFIKLLTEKGTRLFSIASQSLVESAWYDDYYSFSENFVLSKKNRKLGLIHSSGQVVLSTEYDEIQGYRSPYFRVKKRGLWGIIDTGEQIIVPMEYHYITPPDESVSVVRFKQNFGIVNLQGEVVVPLDYTKIELDKNEARAFQGEALTLFSFNDQGQLQTEDEFKKHFTITIGGRNRGTMARRVTRNPWDDSRNQLQLENFEWFYSSREDRWGLRRLDNGEIQIEPTFHTVSVDHDAGFSVVGMEKKEYYDFERTTYRFDMVYGIVKNEVGLLVTPVELWDIRLSDFQAGLPVARLVFSNGRHGLINRVGRIIKRDFGYIGDFSDGLARASVKGRISGSFRKDVKGMESITSYLASIDAASHLVDYTLYDRAFKTDAQITCEDCQWGYLDTLGDFVISPNYSFARDFINQVGIVECEGQWGMVGTEGETLLPCTYDRIEFLPKTNQQILQVYRQQQKYGLIDTLGNVVVNLNYDEIGAFREGRLAVRRKGLWGFCDENGREVIPCRFRKVNNFSEGYATVKQGRFWGVIDKQGNTKVQFKYRRLGNCKNSLVWVTTTKGTGYMNLDEQIVIKPEFSKAFDFEEGVARIVKDGDYGLIDLTGRTIVKPKFTYIDAFNTYGVAVVQYGRSRIRYGLINRLGDVITKQHFRQIRDFSEGLAVVKYKDRYGYIDFRGKLVIKNIYSKAAPFSEGRAAVQRQGVCGYIDVSGNEVIDLEYTKCLDFEDGKAVVYKGYRQGGIVDREGNLIIEPGVSRLLSYSDGRGLVRDGNYRFYYITDDSKIYEGFYDQASQFQHGVAVVQSDDRWGIINQKGMELIPPKYDKIEAFKDGFAKVRIKGFSGLSDLRGQLIVQPNYEFISYAGQGLFRVEQGDKLGYFDRSGKWVWNLD